MLFQLKSCAFKKAYPNMAELKGYYIKDHILKVKQLKCTYFPIMTLDEEIIAKLKEFNQLYTEIGE